MKGLLDSARTRSKRTSLVLSASRRRAGPAEQRPRRRRAPGRAGGFAERRFLGLTSEARYETASKLATGMLAKGIAAPGSVLTRRLRDRAVPAGQDPVEHPWFRPVSYATPTFRYLRQTSRVFAAAPVAGRGGSRSPRSLWTDDGSPGRSPSGRWDQRVRDVPTPSPDHRLADEDVSMQSRPGGRAAGPLGDGSVGHLRGILNTSGIVTAVAVGMDKVATLRAAIASSRAATNPWRSCSTRATGQPSSLRTTQLAATCSAQPADRLGSAAAVQRARDLELHDDRTHRRSARHVRGRGRH